MRPAEAAGGRARMRGSTTSAFPSAELATRGAIASSVWPPLLIAGAASLTMLALATLRYATLHSNAFDLAYFDQVVWNASRGHGFTSSFNPYPFFGQHFSPALALFVPLYALHATPLWLLAAQSAALGLAVLPLYSLASRWIGPELAWLACAAYLLQLFVARAVEFDFHTEALAVPFAFWAVLAAHRGDDRLLFLAGIVPLLCKEDGALVSVGIGLLALIMGRTRSGWALIVASVAYATVVTTVVMPALRGGAPSDIVLRYGYLGKTVPEIAGGMIAHPAAVAGHLLAPEALGALALALLGLGLLPLLRPAAALAALPALLLAFLSDAPAQHALLYQYGLQPGPLLVMAALLGWRRLGRRTLAGAALLVTAAAVLAVAGPRPALDGPDRQRDLFALVDRIPPQASIEASRNVLALISERQDIAQFPAYREEWIVLDGRLNQASQQAELPRHGYRMAARSGEFVLWRRV